jgi:heptosyltransferase-2
LFYLSSYPLIMEKVIHADTIQRLLVRGTNWVGDSVMSLPALDQIRRGFPNAHITLMVLPWVSGIYEDCSLVDEVLLYDRLEEHRGIGGRIRLIQQLRARSFEAAILFQNAFEAALLTNLAAVPLRCGYSRDARGWLLSHALTIDPRLRNLHQSYYYLDLVERFLGRARTIDSLSPSIVSLPPELPPGQWLKISSKRKENARQLLREEGISRRKLIVGVNPGASFGSAKRWPQERYAALLDQLAHDQEADIVIFGSAAEVRIAEAIAKGMRRPPVILSGKTTLSGLIALISCCDLFITNDSGPMHLAAALQIPMLAIFGPTDEIATGPMSVKAIVIKKKVECSPCLLRECPIDHRCMTEIAVEEVYRHAVQQLQKIGA